MGDTPIDINLATSGDFEKLKGIGKAKAKAIIAYRQELQSGAFDSLDQLVKVAGINQSIVQQNQNYLYCTRKRKLGYALSSRKSKRKMINSSTSDSVSGSSAPPNMSLCDSPSGSRASNRGDSSRQSSVFDESEEEPFENVLNYDYLDEEDTNPCDIDDKLPIKSSFCSPGGDTPHEEGGSIDVPLSPMRLSDPDDTEIRDLDPTVPDDEDSLMHVLNPSNLVSCTSQNKRKSELCAENRSLRPAKKSLKAIDMNGDDEISKVGSSVKLSPPPAMKQWLSKFNGWSPSQKLLALDSLIEICDLGQVRHIHQTVLPQFQRNFISLLPKELALHVLQFLSPKDLLVAAQTCKYWNMLTADNLLWKKKCIEASLKDLHLVPSLKRKKSTNIVSHTSAFKVAFMRQHRIEMNWRKGPLKPPRILQGHDDHVITCLQFSNNTIVSGSDDNTLKVWNAHTGKFIRTLVGHTGGVWSSQMCNRYIVSGSTDRVVRVWDIETGECLNTLYGHTSTVRCLHLHGQKVVSGSRDATLRLWDVVTGECEHVLVGHVAAVRCVQYNGRLVVSGAYDFLVKIWNPETEECIHTLQGHTNRVYSLQFDGVHVVSGSLDTTIRVWDVETGVCKHTLMGHQSLTSGMELKDNILISGNADSTVKVWDILTGQCLQTLSGSNKHRSAVTCLQFNNKFVVTSSDDGTVKLWDVKTGEYIRNLVTLQSGGAGGVVWRIRATETKLVCAVGSRNGTEDTKLLVLDFDTAQPISK